MHCVRYRAGVTPRAEAAQVIKTDLESAAFEAGEGMTRGGQWRVHKFGGTCVSAAERIASAAQLVLQGADRGEQLVSTPPIVLTLMLCSPRFSQPPLHPALLQHASDRPLEFWARPCVV